MNEFILFLIIVVLMSFGYLFYIIWKEHKEGLKLFKEFPIGNRYQVFEKTINNITYYTIYQIGFSDKLLIPKWDYYGHYVAKNIAYHNCQRLNSMQTKVHRKGKIEAELKNIEGYRKL